MTAPPEPPYYPLMRAQIDEMVQEARERAPWLEPIAEALRCGCGLLIATQHVGPFRLPREPLKPTIAVIGDDILEALGPDPDAFHLPSLRRLLRAAAGVALISSGPEPIVYRAAADKAVVLRRHVVIIETRIEQEIPWLAFIRKTAPKHPVLLGTVKGGTA
jgi:hypothetical protein